MSIDICNGYLEVLASLNEGCDHACEYQISALDSAVNVHTAVVSYLSSRGQIFSAERIAVIKIPGDWQPQIRAACMRWFFEQTYSPSTKGESLKQNAVVGFLSHLSTVVGRSEAFEIAGPDTMLPAIIWEAYAFSSNGKNWLLHFGWSD